MRPIGSSAAALLACVLLVSVPLQAQSVGFSLGGGVAVPLGTYDEVAKLGWQGTAGFSYAGGEASFGLKVDGTYARFSDETPLDINSQLIFGTANLVYRLQSSSEARVRSYLLGGGGIYNLKAVGDDAFEGSSTDFGVNVGAGLEFGGRGAGLFVEARWHNVFLEGDNLKVLPITLGFRFGT